jgi:cell fate regulator YaaT (PSP1 superfamily)
MNCQNCTFHSLSFKNQISPHVSESDLHNCNKLDSYDWLNDLPGSEGSDLVEVRFKNTRKVFFTNTSGLKLQRGDIVVVDADHGHDTGVVSITGALAVKQFKLKVKNPEKYELKKIYRKAKEPDIQKWKEAKSLEMPALLKARKIAASVHLEMKISDVEYQGDRSKVTFYYTAEDRVDFRELIKIFANEFGVKIEMKQIGARQEAGRIGGIGSCGRELCCSTWRTNLTTISIQAAKYQDLPPHIQKLAGQCGKLKCCLIYELDNYIEQWNDLPEELLELETEKGILYKVKIDILKKVVWYSFEKDSPINTLPVPLDKVKEIIQLNKKGEKAPVPQKPEKKEPFANG